MNPSLRDIVDSPLWEQAKTRLYEAYSDLLIASPLGDGESLGALRRRYAAVRDVLLLIELSADATEAVAPVASALAIFESPAFEEKLKGLERMFTRQFFFASRKTEGRRARYALWAVHEIAGEFARMADEGRRIDTNQKASNLSA